MSISKAIAYLKRTDTDSQHDDALKLSHEDSPAYSVFDTGLACCYLVDRDDHFEYVLNRDLAANAESLSTLDQIGRRNLASFAESRLEVREYGNIFVALMGGNFEASLLLVNELWDTTLSHTITEDYVTAIPARDILAYCDSASPQGISELRDVLARTDPGGDHLLAQDLYRRVDRRWVKYDV